MKVHVLRADELDAGVVEIWRDIQQTNPAVASPYFAPEFSQAVGAARDDAYVAVLEEDSTPHARIAGFFPYQRWEDRGKPIGGSLSDYHGVIIDGGTEFEDPAFDAANLIRACGLKLFDFDHLIASQEAFRSYHSIYESSYIIDIPPDFETYKQAKRKANAREVVRFASHWRNLEKDHGPIRFIPHTDDPAVLGKLIEWKGRQYLETGLVNVFDFPWTRCLVENVLATQNKRFQGVLSALYAGEALVAAHFGMRTPQVLHYWFPAFNHEYGRYSPGSLLLLEMIRDAAARGIPAIDLGKGEAPYKRRLHTSVVMVAEGTIELPSLSATLRNLRRSAEKLARRSPLWPLVRIPGRVIRNIERRRALR